MHSPKISIIIPIFNARKHIKNCLDSVRKQSYENIEVICVNDGSTDDSASILNSFCERDDRISVISIKNSGVSSARYIGFENSTGEYIMFVDADDMLYVDSVSKLAEYSTSSDLIVGGFYRVCAADKKNVYVCPPRNEKIKSIEYIKRMLTNNNINGALWARLYHRNLFQKDVLFVNREITLCEDLIINIRCAKFVSEVQLICEPVYEYKIHDNSVTNSSCSSAGMLSDLFKQVNEACNLSFGQVDVLENELNLSKISLITSTMLLCLRLKRYDLISELYKLLSKVTKGKRSKIINFKSLIIISICFFVYVFNKRKK